MANTRLFGRSYSQIGDTNSDLLLKTKGQLKLQYGNKFIDLIKDGKLNVNSEFIFKAKDINDITGNNGIYSCKDGSVYLKIDNSIIELIGAAGTTYVSFLTEQETTPEQKHQALVNIGFIYNTLDEINSKNLQNGIVYIESENKLYTIVNGFVSEFTVNIPNPFTDQFVIAKNTSDRGAILIKGKGIENSLSFESLVLYEDENSSNIDSDKSITFNINGTQIISLDMLQSVFNVPVSGTTFQSPNANNKTGFRLYLENGKSYLEVDQLILRNQNNSSTRLFPEYWLMKNNIIETVRINSSTELNIDLVQQNEFEIGDIVAFYIENTATISLGTTNTKDKSDNIITDENSIQEEQFKYIQSYYRINGEIIAIQDNTITIKHNQELNQDQLSDLSNQFIYLIKSSNLPIRIKDNNIDIVDYQKEEDGNLTPIIKTRIGDLSEIYKSNGIYSEIAMFKEAKLISDTDITEIENSTTLAPISWIRKFIAPSGIISAFHGSEIPKGWVLCDGKNGTPDLTDKFIKESTSNQYSVVFIMKL